MRILNKPIEMIANFDETGVSPIRFRIDIDGELKTYNVKLKVQDVLKIDKEKILSFKCQIKDGEFIKECEIRYFVESMRWVLYSI